MSQFNPVLAANEPQYKKFKEAVFQSGEDAKLRRLYSAHGIYGTRPKRIVVLPGGWDSVTCNERNLITAYCARNNVSIYNVTQGKLDTFAELLKKEKANAQSKAGS